MGQNRKIREGRDQNELEFVDIFNLSAIQESKKERFPNYDFQTELANDAKNEKKLLYAEILVIFGIIIVVLLRAFLLS